MPKTKNKIIQAKLKKQKKLNKWIAEYCDKGGLTPKRNVLNTEYKKKEVIKDEKEEEEEEKGTKNEWMNKHKSEISYSCLLLWWFKNGMKDFFFFSLYTIVCLYVHTNEFCITKKYIQHNTKTPSE